MFAAWGKNNLMFRGLKRAAVESEGEMYHSGSSARFNITSGLFFARSVLKWQVSVMWLSNLTAKVWVDGSQRAKVTEPVVQHVVIYMSVKVDLPDDEVWNAEADWGPLPRQQAMPAEERCMSGRWREGGGEGERERKKKDEEPFTEALTLLKRKVAIKRPWASYWFHPTTVKNNLCFLFGLKKNILMQQKRSMCFWCAS